MTNHLLYLFAATCLISLAPIFSSIGVPVKGALPFSFFTLFSSFVSLFLFSKFSKKKVVFSRKYLFLSVVFVFGIIFYFYSFDYLSSVTVGFVSQTQLIFTMLISYFLLKEKVNFKGLFSVILVLLGGFVIFYNESLSFNHYGVLLLVLSVSFFAVTNYLTKRLRDSSDSLNIIINRNLFTSVVLFIIVLLSSPGELLVLDASLLFAFLQGFFVDFIGWLLFFYSLKFVKMSTAFIILSFSSIITLIYSFLVFGADINLLQLLGGSMILAGNIIYNIKTKN